MRRIGHTPANGKSKDLIPDQLSRSLARVVRVLDRAKGEKRKRRLVRRLERLVDAAKSCSEEHQRRRLQAEDRK